MQNGSGFSKINSQIFDPIRDLENDDLGRVAFARRLLTRLSERNCSPTIEMYGGQGMRKNLILHLVEHLNKTGHDPDIKKPVIIYLDLWRYEIAGDLTIPILIQLRNLAGSIEWLREAWLP